MGQAKLRRDALAKLPVLTPELKQQIAEIVRSVRLIIPKPGGMCLFRALAGKIALETLGYETDLMYGSVMFAAAPGDINILSMGGPGGFGMIEDDGTFRGHVWLGRRTYPGIELIDFSCGDWMKDSNELTLAYEPDLPLIDWQHEPPPYFWDDLNGNYSTEPLRASDVLVLGKPRYLGFRLDQEALLASLHTRWMESINGHSHYAKRQPMSVVIIFINSH